MIVFLIVYSLSSESPRLVQRMQDSFIEVLNALGDTFEVQSFLHSPDSTATRTEQLLQTFDTAKQLLCSVLHTLAMHSPFSTRHGNAKSKCMAKLKKLCWHQAKQKTNIVCRFFTKECEELVLMIWRVGE